MEPQRQKENNMGKDNDAWKKELKRLGYKDTTDLIENSPCLRKAFKEAQKAVKDPSTKYYTHEEVFGI